jgi:hypothetical protein
LKVCSCKGKYGIRCDSKLNHIKCSQFCLCDKEKCKNIIN